MPPARRLRRPPQSPIHHLCAACLVHRTESPPWSK
jgi:hypothetical protein